MKGNRRRIAGLIALSAAASLAGPAAANAADCSLAGSGLEGPTNTELYQVPDATLEASMLFVDFPDHDGNAADPFPTLTIGSELTSWATTYVQDVSGGRTSLDVSMDNDWVEMSQNANQYSFQTFAQQKAFMAEAVAKAEAAPGGFDFSGRQTLYVVAAHTGGVLKNSPAFHAYNNDAIVADGTAIRWGSSLGDDSHVATNNYGSHVLAHETGHTFGLPDLYTYQDVFDFATQHLNAGAWDLMGWIGPGLGFNAWHRQKLGWLDPAQVVCVEGEATATLSPLAATGGTKMMIAKTSASTAYVAEVRTPVGVDSGMCHPGGVLIYKVDANAPTGGPVDNGPIFVELPDPGNAGDPNDSVCGALQNAPFTPGQSFTAGAVTVQVLSGSPATGYEVRMTGPVSTPDPGPGPGPGPAPDPIPTPSAKTGGIEAKLRLDGKKRVIAALSCPAGATACTGTVTLSLTNGKKLANGAYSVAPPGGDVPLKLNRKARKALNKAFGKKDKAKATALLDGADGRVTQKVKLVR
jgi:M6 family metalloprotease-like protein